MEANKISSVSATGSMKNVSRRKSRLKAQRSKVEPNIPPSEKKISIIRTFSQGDEDYH